MKIVEILLLVYLMLIVGYYSINYIVRLFNGDSHLYTVKGGSLKKMFEEKK